MEEGSMRMKHGGSVEGEVEVGKKGSLTKHYPWLLTFDNEVKARLTTTEVTNTHVLKLITLLESNISPEVTKLRNKPNRATKLLAQIKKRVSMAKIGGYMIDSECEQELFPTYGLLMTHFVNLTLVSSKIEKYGAQQVASELYYFLKLMFHSDKEYILDVALCSTLDEYATSKHKVGFQLFSFIVEDWRCYSESHSCLMKYCAVSSLFSAASVDGQIFVERHLPAEMDKDFPKFVNKTLHIDIGGPSGLNKKKGNLKAVIRGINVVSVKSISRHRLVVVSKKDISKNIRENSPEMSDTESVSSTVVNGPTSSNGREKPSSSNAAVSSVDDFLNEIGVSSGFCLDTAGYSSTFFDKPQESGISYEEEEMSDYLGCSNPDDHSHDDMVSSSSNVQTSPQKKSSAEKYSQKRNLLQDSSDSETDAQRSRVKLKKSDSEPTYELGTDDESSKRDSVKRSNPFLDAEASDDDDYELAPPTKERIQNTVEMLDGASKTDESDDSDLEVLSERSFNRSSDDSDCESNERDEAEPESGEDVLPNYDSTSSEEEDEIESTEVDQGVSKTQKADPENEKQTENLVNDSTVTHQTQDEDDLMSEGTNNNNNTEEFANNDAVQNKNDTVTNEDQQKHLNSQDLDKEKSCENDVVPTNNATRVPVRKSKRIVKPKKELDSSVNIKQARRLTGNLADQLDEDMETDNSSHAEASSEISSSVQSAPVRPSRRGRKSLTVPAKEPHVVVTSPRITRTRASTVAAGQSTPAKIKRTSSVSSTSEKIATAPARTSRAAAGRGRRGRGTGARLRGKK